MKYVRKPGDKGFRTVSLAVSAVQGFTMFTQPNQTVILDPEQQKKCVIEILREDDTSFLVKPEQRIVEYYTVVGADKIYISTKLPYARLWTRKVGQAFPCYKVPVKLFEDSEQNRAAILFCDGAQNVELFGDCYFQALYDLQRS